MGFKGVKIISACFRDVASIVKAKVNKKRILFWQNMSSFAVSLTLDG